MNSRSRWIAAIAAAFTVLVGAPTLAHADTVALLPVTGPIDSDRLEAIEQRVATILREQGHRLAPPTASTVDRPPSSARMEEIATGSNAMYVVAAEVEGAMRGQYRLAIHVYYRAAGRMEELVAVVVEAEERERLSDILSAMVRRGGLGDDALRLTGEPEDPDARAQREAEEQARRDAEAAAQREADERAQAEEEARRREEAEADAAREAEEQARRDAEERERAEQAFANRAQYGTDGDWMLQLQVGGGYALPLSALPGDRQGGGGMFDLGARVGRTFEGVDGFEVRAGLDFHTGAFTAVGIHAGAAWLGSLFVEPVYIGLGGEVGVVFTTTGSRDAGFSGRIMALFAWRPIEHLYLEVAIPELGVITPGAGAVTIGASARLGYRF